MKLKDYIYNLKKVSIHTSSRSKNKRHRLKKALYLLFILLLPLLITNLISIENLNNQTKEHQVIKEIQLKSSNPGDDIFKLIYGTSNISSLDPQNAWDTSSFEVMDQICEGLFTYNLSDPNNDIIPNLAEDYGIWNDNNYTVTLKTGITFHDGTPFNSTAVQFTFDRLAYFMDNYMALAGSLYEYYDPDLGMLVPIINRTEIIDVDTIKFVLNKPYGLFETLLCFPASYILSPTSTPPTEYIDKTTGDLIGTGPFVFDHYIEGEETLFHGYANYWAGNPNITILKFSILSTQAQNDALLAGEVDMIASPLDSMLPTFEADPQINVINIGQGGITQYLGMNNERINVTWRKAISYSINYSHIISEVLGEQYVRLKSPIPESILFANWSFDVATFNITKAREIIQSMGFGGGWDTTYPGSNESDWSSASFATFNFSYNYGNWFREALLPILQNNLSKIGIVVTDAGMDWGDYWDLIFIPENYTQLELFQYGWMPDYNDPSDYINSLLTNRTEIFNPVQYNGYKVATEAGRNEFYLWDNVQLLMEEALFENNPSLRESYYNRIQEILVEEDMPVAYLAIKNAYFVCRNHILGFQPTSLPYLSFFGITENSTTAPQSIYIDGNEEWQYFKDAGKCTGQGTDLDPYIIRDLVIDGRNNSVSCIRIENSDVYFRIENCTLFNSQNAGIELINVSNSQLIGNNCSNNNFGIYLDPSAYNEIFNNLINNNNLYGILLKIAYNNSIFNNTIIWNTINAFDNGTNNDWDNGVIGNYWSDYDGMDLDNDGIGDTPYIIPGGSQDNFPLWDRYLVPGINEYVPSEQIIKIGVLNDLNTIQGDNGWKGAYLAAKEINEAGGVLINSTIFYIGLHSGNTFEEEGSGLNVNITKGINAANNLITNYNPDFIIGGSNYFALSAYLEPIMDAKIPFLNTGVMHDNLTQNVLNNYTRYKYFFDMIINSSELAREIITFEFFLYGYLNSTLGRPINKIAILYNPSYILMSNFVEYTVSWLIANRGIELVKEITFDHTATKDDFASYWDEIDNAGAQITVVGEYSENVKLISETYGEVEPRCLMFSFNDYNYRDTYWDDTYGGCEYEVTNIGIYNVSRTPRSIPYWNNFVNEYNHEPAVDAGTSYNAIYLILNATLDSQSLSATKIVESLEKIDTSNTFPGVGGNIAFTSSHSLFNGVGYGSKGYPSAMMVQWQAGGSREVINNNNLIYPDSLASEFLQIPNWGINIRFTINSPIESTIFTEMAPTLNIEILDSVDKMWYTLNSGSEKYFFTDNTTLNQDFQTTWENELSDGPVKITFYANDTSGHIFKRYVNIIKDTEPPDVSIEPMETTIFGSEAPTIVLNIQDVSNITASYYSLDGGVTKIPFTGNEVTINQSLWEELKEGAVQITFYIIDSVGKETIVYVDVYKDLPGAPGADNLLFFIIIGVIALALGAVSTIVYTQHRRKKKRKTEWIKLKKKKGLISPELAEGKNLMFISYATKDSDLFQIPLITDILVQYPEIDDILYWESDMHDDIYEYMDDNLKLCSVFLLFCTENSLYSEPVKMEWRSALKLDKKIIPIFINPNDIPPLLTTKLGVQFNESEVYDSIEAIYQMILKKLEVTSTREFCKYLVPKLVSDEYFEEQTPPMVKKDIEIESDIPTDDLQTQFISILEKNNFQFLKKPKEAEELEKSESQLISLRFFAEDKFEKQEIGLTATIQKVEDYKNKVYLRVMGNKEWMVNAILSDLGNKIYPLKPITELLREYSEEIEDFIDQIDNLDEFLRKYFGAEIKKIEDLINQYLNKQVIKKDFIEQGIQLLGKRFLLVFIESLPRTSQKKKNLED